MWQSIHQLDQVRSVSNSSTTFDAFCICLQIPGPSHPNSSCTGRPPTQRTVVLRPECKPQLGLDNTMKVPLIPHRFQKVTKYLLFFTSVLRLISQQGQSQTRIPNHGENKMCIHHPGVDVKKHRFNATACKKDTCVKLPNINVHVASRC